MEFEEDLGLMGARKAFLLSIFAECCSGFWKMMREYLQTVLSLSYELAKPYFLFCKLGSANRAHKEHTRTPIYRV